LRDRSAVSISALFGAHGNDLTRSKPTPAAAAAFHPRSFGFDDDEPLSQSLIACWPASVMQMRSDRDLAFVRSHALSTRRGEPIAD
jgi:hypothetical protein